MVFGSKAIKHKTRILQKPLFLTSFHTYGILNEENIYRERPKMSNQESRQILSEYIPMLERKMDRLMKYETEIRHNNQAIEPVIYFLICLSHHGITNKENPQKTVIEYFKKENPDNPYFDDKSTLLPGEVWEWLILQDVNLIHDAIDEFLYEVTIQEAQSLWQSIQNMLAEVKVLMDEIKELPDALDENNLKETQRFFILQVNIYEFIKANLENVGFMDQDYTLIYEVYELIDKPCAHVGKDIDKGQISYEFMDLLCKNLIRKRDSILGYLNSLKQIKEENIKDEDEDEDNNPKIKSYF